MKKKDKGFKTIRVKESDHDRMTSLVTHDTKIHDIVTQALDALDRASR